ncbi:hypothetical protein SFRURICE_003068 [Spodoptera frugiperda]|uniref:SFRICE_017561 n=1 Tax=Spodoptera frugiperda TaxID=7108 RepID=A0A2H1VGQ5_SPOFR|nr:hypothetical protein SFRURICE_003068 [Spodoptera frugiperda]
MFLVRAWRKQDDEQAAHIAWVTLQPGTKVASSAAAAAAEAAPTRGTSPIKLVPADSHLSPIVRLSHRS